ncbi:MAG: response regulator [Sulfuricurvum sp.]|nr:response regulator [Sulfuricurvum sp.]
MNYLSEKTILIAEDHRESNDNLAFYFKSLFKKVICAYDGAEAWQMYCDESPDIILTDIEMPRMDGLQLVQKIRADDQNVQIIILTSYSHQHYLLKAIPLKLTSYVLKPITFTKLNDLVKQIEGLRQENKKKMVLNDIQDTVYDFGAKIVMMENQRVVLSNLEIGLIELLINNRGLIVYYEEMEDVLYSSQPKSRNALKIVVSSVRKKIPTITIQAIPKIGYRLL